MCKAFEEYLNDIGYNPENITVDKMYSIMKNENYEDYMGDGIGFRITNDENRQNAYAWSNLNDRNYDIKVEKITLPNRIK